jgi:hypothetical protein
MTDEAMSPLDRLLHWLSQIPIIRDLGGDCEPPVRGLLHYQGERFGPGAVDLPFDHRSARRPIVGERECAPGCHLSLHGARPPG